jgi:hypothetical protein
VARSEDRIWHHIDALAVMETSRHTTKAYPKSSWRATYYRIAPLTFEATLRSNCSETRMGALQKSLNLPLAPNPNC